MQQEAFYKLTVSNCLNINSLGLITANDILNSEFQNSCVWREDLAIQFHALLVVKGGSVDSDCELYLLKSFNNYHEGGQTFIL